MFSNFDYDVIIRSLPYLFYDGMTFTLALTAFATAGGIIFGTLLAMMRLSGFAPISVLAAGYVNLMRSVPLLLVIFWFYFLMPYIGQWITGASRPVQVGASVSSFVTFTLFEAAYFAEIMRAGIQSIPRGQVAAAQALGMTYLQTMGYIVLRSPAKPPYAENVVMETTYGDRLHKQLGPSIDEFYEAITETFKRGGNVIIPTFALERAQELLYYLSEGVTQGRLTKSTQVYLDSPMAISATAIFRRHPECFEPATAKLFQEGHDPFALPGLHFTKETAESVAINSIPGGAIIMAGSGMCTGGRVRHHLQHNLGREDSSIVFVGYAAIGTLARSIIDGAKQVNIFGENISVRARIYTINGFSAHADQAELLAWQKQTSAKRTFLVHGEEDIMRQFAANLVDTRVEMPGPNQVFEL